MGLCSRATARHGPDEQDGVGKIWLRQRHLARTGFITTTITIALLLFEKASRLSAGARWCSASLHKRPKLVEVSTQTKLGTQGL